MTTTVRIVAARVSASSPALRQTAFAVRSARARLGPPQRQRGDRWQHRPAPEVERITNIAAERKVPAGHRFLAAAHLGDLMADRLADVEAVSLVLADVGLEINIAVLPAISLADQAMAVGQPVLVDPTEPKRVVPQVSCQRESQGADIRPTKLANGPGQRAAATSAC
jgi:hypothetical protein